jgi:PPOX class probable F420-dependent enzyme
MLSDLERRFLADRRVGHLATADRQGVPHVVPVCFTVFEGTAYVTIDEKPKSDRAPLKRVRNIMENPAAAFVADRYDDDWSLLGWIMLRGRARILSSGAEHDDAQARLRHRYPQLESMQISTLPVIAVQIERVTSWGNLSIAPRV